MAVKVGNDLVEFLNDLCIFNGLATNVGQCLRSLLDPVLLDEPSGAFILEDDAYEEQDTGEHLEGKWDTPLRRVGRIRNVEIDTVIDEEGQTDTCDVEKLLLLLAFVRDSKGSTTHHAADTSSSNLLWRVFTDVCGYDRRNQSDAESSNNTANVKLSQAGGTERTKSLHKRADDEDDIGNDEGPFSAKGVANIEGGQCAEKTSSLEHGNDVTLEIGELGALCI